MEKVIEANKIILNELNHFLDSLEVSQYQSMCAELENKSIGQHTRHVIEMYECLINGYETGVVDYDGRKRNFQIESDLEYAKKSIQSVIQSLDKKNTTVNLTQEILEEPSNLESNYYRELLYNYEHCIHHKALIKVACINLENVELSSNFGIAPSTLKFEKNVHC